jgi:hypothetical protein
VKKRIGDRRHRTRFEIVGTLTGTLETLRRFRVRNLGTGGALVDAATPLAPGSRMTGRLSFRGRSREVRGEVRHITTLADRTEGLRYLIGVQWDSATQLDDLLGTEPLRLSQSGPRQGLERRASARLVPGGDVEIGQPTWSTVELLDISTAGVLFASPVGVEIGERGELRVRLGERSFAAQIEVRRSDERKASQGAYRLGASFVSLDESSRVHLEDFIGGARR